MTDIFLSNLSSTRVRDDTDPTKIAAVVNANENIASTKKGLLAWVPGIGEALTSLTSLLSRVGEVQASPTANTVLDRLKAIATLLSGTLRVQGAGTLDTPSGGVQSVHVIDPDTQLPFSSIGATEVVSSVDDPNRPRGINCSGTIIRPSNTTPYSIGDHVANDATAGSVVAGVLTASDVADHPVAFEGGFLKSTDTGLNGVRFEVWMFNSNPTANSGVGGGDNAAFSQKQAGFRGKFVGTFTTSGVSDGAVAELVPAIRSRLISYPTVGLPVFYFLLRTLDAFSPSANSSTFTLTMEGYQLRA